jgi:hypothetical protein
MTDTLKQAIAKVAAEMAELQEWLEQEEKEGNGSELRGRNGERAEREEEERRRRAEEERLARRRRIELGRAKDEAMAWEEAMRSLQRLTEPEETGGKKRTREEEAEEKCKRCTQRKVRLHVGG